MEHSKSVNMDHEVLKQLDGPLVWKGKDVCMSSSIIDLQPHEVDEVECGLKSFKGKLIRLTNKACMR